MPQASGLYQSPLLSRIAVDYKNRAYIAERVLPVIDVPKKLFQYLSFDQGVTFKRQRTTYGQDGTPGMLDIKGQKNAGSINDRALMAFIDPEELSMAPEAMIRARKTEKLANAMRLDLEMMVAGLVFNSGSYAAGQSTTLSGTSQWSDYTNSDPAAAILSAQDTLPIKANKLVVGRQVATVLKRHPKILDVTKYTTRGFVPFEALAEYFEVEEFIVGEAFFDTAAEGQAQSRSYVWGKHAALLYTAKNPDPVMDQPTFGCIPRLGGQGGPSPWRTYTGIDPMRGTGEGREFVKVETTDGTLIQANQMGSLFLNAVA